MFCVISPKALLYSGCNLKILKWKFCWKLIWTSVLKLSKTIEPANGWRLYKGKCVLLLFLSQRAMNTRAVRKVTVPFEYHENRSRGLDVKLVASLRRPYCASVNSHSPVGLVSRQWDAVGWIRVLCDRRIHNDRASRSASSRQCACPFCSSRAGFFDEISHHSGLSAPL